jgi:hypothetical protein
MLLRRRLEAYQRLLLLREQQAIGHRHLLGVRVDIHRHRPS